MSGVQPPALQRYRSALHRRVHVIRHAGNTVECPLCGHRFDRFRDDRGRPNAICWRCGSHERHRAQWLLFTRRPELLGNVHRLLQFAPEWCLRRHLARIDHLTYVTADLMADDVDLTLDLTALDLADASFDAIICSHVLEHVDDDRAAMTELFRVLSPGGWCLVMVPLDLGRGHTYEDPSITDPAERERAFLQHDHVRLYAADIGDRLRTAGFTVERILPLHEFGEEALRRYRLLPSDELWLCGS